MSKTKWTQRVLYAYVCVHAYINIAMIKKGQEFDGVKETQEEFGTGRGRGRKDGSKEFNSKILKIFN